MWLLHQHRTAYDLWNSAYSDLIHFPNGLQIRESIINADNKAFSECTSVFTNAGNVSKRLKQFNNVNSIPLYHPPQNAELFYCEEQHDYFFFPSRLNTIKRQEIVLQALAETKKPVKVLFAGQAEQDTYADHLLKLTEELQLQGRAIFLGAISQEEKIKHYARALGVIYPPFDEDYGYVTLEAMLASKPVITCADSGGPLEFVRDQETGLIAEPTPKALATAMDHLWENRTWAKALGKAGRDRYDSLDITWSKVIKNLLS